MRTPNDIKRPNPKPLVRRRTRRPICRDGLNRLYQYRDGVVHQVVLRTVYEGNKGKEVGDHLIRTSPRPYQIMKMWRKHIKDIP